MAFRISNIVAMVTGGASGLGRATVEHFIRNGARVALLDLPSSKGKEVAAGLGENKCLFCPTDITDTDDIIDAVEATRDTFGSLQVLVNCAGIGVARKVYNEQKKQSHSLEEFQKVMRVNVVGTFDVIRNAISLMLENTPGDDMQRGVIINTASVAAFDGQMGQAAYSASKGAIVGMTLPLARDCGRMGIRTVTIAPGVFMTPLLESLPEKVIKLLEKDVPFPPRLGKPEEFASLAQSIVENPMLNGETIRLDGALRMK